MYIMIYIVSILKYMNLTSYIYIYSNGILLYMNKVNIQLF